jgi:serine/threonine-protein kinase
VSRTLERDVGDETRRSSTLSATFGGVFVEMASPPTSPFSRVAALGEACSAETRYRADAMRHNKTLIVGSFSSTSGEGDRVHDTLDETSGHEAATRSTSGFEPGTVVGERYVLLRQLGEGGMGTVYEAQHMLLGHRVALKVPRADLSAAVACDRFLREAQLAAQADHPNVVRVVDAGPLGQNRCFLVMELLEGEDLDSYVTTHPGPLHVREAARLVSAVCHACVRMHGLGIVHRDLKPSNVFLTKSGEVKVLDFGLAKAATVESHTKTGIPLGTPDFMAPEQVLSARDAGPAADRYAIGGLLYFALTGRSPLDGITTVPGKFARILEGGVGNDLRQLRPDVPEPVERLVRDLMALSPEARVALDRAIVLLTTM